VARVVALIPDLLFGSNVAGALGAAGLETVLVSDDDALARELSAAQLLIVDLTTDAEQRIEQVRRVRRPGIPVLAFYAHVEADVRERAQTAGFELVVPRSRMAREGAQLAARMLGGQL
jgi:CheY-like chemotaxis protein